MCAVQLTLHSLVLLALASACRTDNAVKNHWNSTLKRRRAEYAPGGPLDVSAVTAALQRRLAAAGTGEDGEHAWLQLCKDMLCCTVAHLGCSHNAVV
jgi:hypothetical protein